MAESKSMDVSKAGKTAPDATARPVIVGHRPLLKQDPMVSSDEPQTDVTKKTEEKSIGAHAEKIITPPSEVIEKPLEESDTPESTKPDIGASPPEGETEAPVSDDAAVVDAVAEQAGANKKKGALTEEEKKQQQAINKLIEEKKYFIPIKVASRKRHAKWNLVLLLVLILLASSYLLVDAGALGSSIKLPFSVLHKSTVPSQSSLVPASQPELANASHTSDPYGDWATYTSPLQNFSLRYPKDWKITSSSKQMANSTPDETAIITSPTGMKITYGLLDYDTSGESPETTSCGTQSVCGVDVVYDIQTFDVPKEGQVMLVKIGTDKPITDGIYQQAAGEYGMRLHMPMSTKSTPVKGANKLGSGKNGYMINYRLKGKNRDWLSVGAQFPDSYKTKTPKDVFSSNDAAVAEKILRSITFN